MISPFSPMVLMGLSPIISLDNAPQSVTPVSHTRTYFTAVSSNADVKEFDISDLEGELT
ncbi:hypothetical protein [Yersinia rohdei]|uniref:hypothetical protein n=1 Tax=Yersinia rohdei TaxID=29485 RepID=UPI000A97A9E2|nr:hypothetical protein [Yersinia rohdei]